MGASKQRHMKHARKLDVVDKQSAPGRQPIVFTSRQRPANPAVAVVHAVTCVH